MRFLYVLLGPQLLAKIMVRSRYPQLVLAGRRFRRWVGCAW